MRSYLFSMILFIFVPIVFATNGSIEGLVIDARSGEPLWNANIVVVGEGKGAATAENGEFFIPEMGTGTHELRFSMIGYRTVVKNRVIVKSGRPTILKIQLNEDVATGKTIEVKPTYFEKVEGNPVSTHAMDYEELASQPGGGYDISRALTAMPSVTSAADTENDIIVRGGNAGENLFLMDNIEIPNPNHFGRQGEGGGKISAVYMDFVEDITFFAGAFPAKYGHRASSILDINLREGSKDDFHFKLDLGMSGLGTNVEGPYAKGKGSYMVSYHRSFLDLIASTWNMTAVPQYWSTQSKFVYDFDPKNKLSLFVLYAKDWIVLEMDEEETMEYNVDSRSDQYTIGVNYKHILKKGFNIMTVAATQNSWHLVVEDSLFENIIFSNFSTENNYSIKNNLTMFLTKKDEIQAGLYLKYSDFDYDYFDDYDTLKIYEPGTDSILGVTDYHFGMDTISSENMVRSGGFLQYRRKFGARFVSNIGLRIDDSRWSGSTYFSPRASLSYKITSETDLSLAYGRHYQSPDLFELAFAGEHKNLDYYYTDQAVVGLSSLLMEDLKASVEVYYKNYKDKPIQKHQLTEDPYDVDNDYINGLDGYSQGIEFFVQKKVKENLWGTLSYSFSRARDIDVRPDTDSTSYGEYPKDFDYGHVFNGIVGYQVHFKEQEWYKKLSPKLWWRLISWLPGMPSDETGYAVKYRYVGGRPYNEMTYHPEHRYWAVDPGDAINQSRLPYYSTLDLHIRSRWYFGKLTLLSYFELDNVFNRDNIWTYNHNSDGSRDQINQRGIMPVGGVIIEF